jgi:hypothetical protein
MPGRDVRRLRKVELFKRLHPGQVRILDPTREVWSGRIAAMPQGHLEGASTRQV